MIIVELIVTGIIEFLLALLFHIPGSFIRWIFTGFKKGKLKQFYKEDPGTNALVAILFFLFIGMIIWGITSN